KQTFSQLAQQRQCAPARQRKSRRTRYSRQPAHRREDRRWNMTDADILRDSPAYIHRVVGELQQLREQVGELDSIDAERAKAQARVDAVTKELEIRRGEVKEVKWQHDQILKTAREDQAKNERLKAENKRLTAANAALDADIKTSRGRVAQVVKTFSEEVESA